MAFMRSFDIERIKRLIGEKAELFARLKADVLTGDVFPSVRKDELHFYYKGGCLYRFAHGSFKRNSAYDKEEYSTGTAGLDDYDNAKIRCKNKYASKDDGAKERQLLDRLNGHTFKQGDTSMVVVLDIEVNLNGEASGQKKCDLVLLNKDTKQIMFVEGKVFSDKRVLVAVGFTPEVIEQVKTYTAAIAEQASTIVEQYAEHIRIVKELFCGGLPEKVTLIPAAKLLVYDTPKTPTANGAYTKKTITDALGAENVMWITVGNEPTLNEIWDALCK